MSSQCHGIEWDSDQQCMICQAIATEKHRIVQTIRDEAITWVKPASGSFSYRQALIKLADKIQGPDLPADYKKIYSCLTHRSGGTVPCSQCADVTATIRSESATAYNNADVDEIKSQERERITQVIKNQVTQFCPCQMCKNYTALALLIKGDDND